MNKQTGVALLLVLMVMAILATVAVEISGRTQLALKRTMHMANNEQGYWYAISAEELAKKVLKQDLDDAKGKVNLQQFWASDNIVFPVDEAQLAGKIKDMRACFNVNALAQAPSNAEQQLSKQALATRQLQSLLESLQLNGAAAEQLSHGIADFVDSDSETAPYGAEDADYEARPIPYRAANTLLQHKSELRSILGINERTYFAIKDLVCAIPGNQSQVLNVNTLDQEHGAILSAMLLGAVTVDEAANIISRRPAEGWDSLNDFWQDSGVDSNALEANVKSTLVISSDYFELQAGVQIDGNVFLLSSILKKSNNNQMKVLSRQLGGQQ
ncbi:type II secretion system minor pseudopilin GspK [Paraferrimonas sp. SM1919]|uniref:type II secretion system minor pseudopilin GspK n=1 Tax=Paraferrimonas sp. SM1919 TaxID=2662263 RepID=UPI0013D5583F|nr:type II secretion system minor pseudopilin GspK [Paraferrimonas sp. SM1919]